MVWPAHGHAQAPAGDPLAPLLAALPTADLVLFPPPRPGQAPRLVFAALVKASPARVRSLLTDPAAYQRAVPAFVEAKILEERRAGGAAPDKRVAWEVEVPLWNLAGELWMRPRSDGAELELTRGDLAPGRYRLTAVPHGAHTVLRMEGHAAFGRANFATRRLAARSPLAEPAMSATAGYVLLRALALEAERTGSAPSPQRFPRGGIAAPAVGALDGARLARVLAAHPVGNAQAIAAVHRRSDGRLDRIELAAAVTASLTATTARLRDPEAWRALPGWRKLTVVTRRTDGSAEWEVDSSMPFVDFDAVWAVTPGPPFRAAAVRGDWTGGVLGWDLDPSSGPGPTIAVLSMHPRLERTGYMPRKFIEAEPLLEGGLALGLTYVNALSMLSPLGLAGQ